MIAKLTGRHPAPIQVNPTPGALNGPQEMRPPGGNFFRTMNGVRHDLKGARGCHGLNRGSMLKTVTVPVSVTFSNSKTSGSCRATTKMFERACCGTPCISALTWIASINLSRLGGPVKQPMNLSGSPDSFRVKSVTLTVTVVKTETFNCFPFPRCNSGNRGPRNLPHAKGFASLQRQGCFQSRS